MVASASDPVGDLSFAYYVWCSYRYLMSLYLLGFQKQTNRRDSWSDQVIVMYFTTFRWESMPTTPSELIDNTGEAWKPSDYIALSRSISNLNALFSDNLLYILLFLSS